MRIPRLSSGGVVARREVREETSSGIPCSSGLSAQEALELVSLPRYAIVRSAAAAVGASG